MKIRIDFGRVLPGILLLVTALILIVVLLLVAIVAFLFSFVVGVGGIVGLALELMLVPALLIVAGIITVVAGVSWWAPGGEGWSYGWAARRASKDRMRVGDRVGEIIALVLGVIIFLFFYENQLRGAAFFASSFGSLAQFYFYGPLVTGMVLSFARAAYGRRNAIRPFDVLNSLFLSAASFWLFSAFPFNFARFGEMFPSSIQFLFGWLNNDIGHILLFLGGLVSLVSAVYTLFLYSAVRGQLRRRADVVRDS